MSDAVTSESILYALLGEARMAFPSEDLRWRLRYTVPNEADSMAAATALESYAYLVNNCTKEDAWTRIKAIRAALTAAKE